MSLNQFISIGQNSLDAGNNPDVKPIVINDEVNRIEILCFNLQRVVHLPAFITSFSDNFNSSWNVNTVYGRADSVYTYKNTSRKVNISFDVPASSIEEAKAYHYRLNTVLRKSIYPTYLQREGDEERYVISTPPYHRIRYANLIKSNRPYAISNLKGFDSSTMYDGLFGWIDGYTFSPKEENGFFVVSDGMYAKVHNVSLTLNVIHEHSLGFRNSGSADDIVVVGRTE